MKYSDMQAEAEQAIREAEQYAAEHGITNPEEKLNLFLDRFGLKMWRKVHKECDLDVQA